jgi:DNA-binding MarR family transcriptional regulator
MDVSPVYAVLGRLLIAYTYEFDAAMKQVLGASDEAPPALAMWANVLRFVGDAGVEIATLPKLSGIARPTIKSMLDCLHRHGWIVIDDARTVTLTKRGQEAQRAWAVVQPKLDRQWEALLGDEALRALRTSLDRVLERAGPPYPEYPMPAAHRGGHPKGE